MGEGFSVGLPPGTVGLEFLTACVKYVNSTYPSTLEVKGDELIVHNCDALADAIRGLAEELVKSGITRVFMSGNDYKAISSLGTLLGAGGKPRAADLILKASEIIKKYGCRVNALINTYLPPQMLRLNYYEYERVFLRKPSRKPSDKLRSSGLTITLALAGVLLCDAGICYVEKGRRAVIHQYLIPSIHVGIKQHRSLIRNLRIVSGMPTCVKEVVAASTLFLEGLKNDLSYGKLLLLQERRNRASIISTEAMHTEGLIRLFVRSPNLPLMIRTLCFMAARSESVSKSAVPVVNHLLIYARTNSIDSLSLSTSLLSRLLNTIVMGKSEDAKAFRRVAKDLGVNNPEGFLKALISAVARLRC